MIWRGVQEGDWVKATDTLAIGLFGNSTIKRGTKGVVTSVVSGWLTSRRVVVAFDSGFGSVNATVSTSEIRVVRREGGVDRFKARQSRLFAARVALGVFVTWP